MTKRTPLYDEVKATQVAALLLKLNGGAMPFYKCIKLLYSIEKEALNRWMHPVLYDKLCSMPHGQVVSHSLDRAKYRGSGKVNSFWNEHLETTIDSTIKDETNNKTIHIIKDCGIEKLSRAEMELIREIYEINKHKTVNQIIKEHHDHNIFPEWEDPGKTSKETTYSNLLSTLGKTTQEINTFLADLSELAALKRLAC